MAYLLPNWSRFATKKDTLVDLGPASIEQYTANTGALITPDGEDAAAGEILDLLIAGRINRDEFDEVVKLAPKKTALKNKDGILAQLTKSHVEQGVFYAIRFPAIKDVLRRPAKFWHHQITRHGLSLLDTDAA